MGLSQLEKLESAISRLQQKFTSLRMSPRGVTDSLKKFGEINFTF
jgi:hypothetical protein